MKTHIEKRWPDGGEAVCDEKVEGEEKLSLTSVARESDCDACRAVLLIAPVKDLSVKGPPVYEPKPMENIESLEEIRARRDGR